MKLKKSVDCRGFDLINFKDHYDHKCSIQKSSLATKDAIWIGIDDVEPKIMAKDAKKLGIETDESVGWIDYPVPEEVLMTSRMHLTQKQAADLIPILEHFVETGEIDID